MRTLTSATLLVIAGLATLGGGLSYAEKKVTVCHVPPGDPGNAHTITVGESAVSAHLAHGDDTSPCATGCGATLCNDGDWCTSDSCDANGECAYAPVSCEDGNDCTVDTCDRATGCHNDPIAGCCTTSDDCDDGVGCTVDTCQDGTCRNQTDCTVVDQCVAGFCDATGGCNTAPVSCDDSNVCTDDGCNSSTGCFHNPTQNPPQPTETLCPQAPQNDCEASFAEKECRRNAASCADGADNDCDGLLDGDDPDCWFCGDGDLQAGVMTPGACRDGFGFPQDTSVAEECDDGNENPVDGCDRCIVVINHED